MGNQCSCTHNTDKQLQLEINQSQQLQHQYRTPTSQSILELEQGKVEECRVPHLQHHLHHKPSNTTTINHQQYLTTTCMITNKPATPPTKKPESPPLNLQKEIEQNTDQVIPIIKQFTKSHLGLIVKTLTTHCIFSQLLPEQILFVISHMKYCSTEKNKYIFKKGDDALSFYIILQGKCKIQTNHSITKYIESPNYFGDLGIIYRTPRCTSAFAMTNCLFASLPEDIFRQIITKISVKHEKKNRQILQKMDFFRQLTHIQQDFLVLNCITEVYTAGQIIFNKEDDANALYIIQQGTVQIVQKKLQLNIGQYVGINAVMANKTTTRSNTLQAKTQCKLLSLTRQLLTKNLGDNFQNTLHKNLLLKILKQSRIWQMYTQQQWTRMIEFSQLKKYNSGDIIFSNNQIINPQTTVYIILNSDVKSSKNPKTDIYYANSIIQIQKISKHQQIIFYTNYICTNETTLAILSIPKQKKITDSSLYLSQKSIKNQLKTSQYCNTNQNKQNIKLKDFRVLHKLRSGNFGKVYACFNYKTLKKYAIKVIDKQKIIASNLLYYIIKQQQYLRTIPPHPFLVKYYTMFKNHSFIMLVMELIQGQDLYDAINTKFPLNQESILFFISQLILVIEHLHKYHIVYRDLKPQNIILNLDGYLTLVDLGASTTLTPQNKFKTMTIIGTPHYMAPQVILGKGYGFSVDWWSLGIMMYQMACGKLPYGENIEDPFSVYQAILTRETKFTANVGLPMRDIISKLLNKNPNKRLKNGSTQLKQSSFFTNIQWNQLTKKQCHTDIFPSRRTPISQEEMNDALTISKITALEYFIRDKDKNC